MLFLVVKFFFAMFFLLYCFWWLSFFLQCFFVVLFLVVEFFLFLLCFRRVLVYFLQGFSKVLPTVGSSKFFCSCFWSLSRFEGVLAV